MFIERHLSKTILNLSNQFPIVLLTGHRQVGKSTILQKTFTDMKYITLDDPNVFISIKTNALEFFKLQGTPLIVDEVQKASESFSCLKFLVDKDRKNGMYFLTGSQRFNLMQGVSESLAGRICILNMFGLSAREIYGDNFDTAFLPTLEYITSRNTKIDSDVNLLWQRIHRGCMPELYNNSELEWESFYASYLNTYIERDVNQLAQVGDTLSFMQFVISLASRTGELLNYDSIAKDVGVDIRTIKKWVSILQASGIIYLLNPFSLNVNKRTIKTPKVYFTDTGLVCYLTKWLTPSTLMNGAMAGQIFETYVFNEIFKSYTNAGKEPNIYFFRNTDGQEVDFLFYQNGVLYPVEVKKTAQPNLKDIKHFSALSKFFPTLEVGEGAVVCTYDKVLPLDEKNRIVPISFI